MCGVQLLDSDQVVKGGSARRWDTIYYHARCGSDPKVAVYIDASRTK